MYSKLQVLQQISADPNDSDHQKKMLGSTQQRDQIKIGLQPAVRSHFTFKECDQLDNNSVAKISA